jgi:hypothetical protein
MGREAPTASVSAFLGWLILVPDSPGALYPAPHLPLASPSANWQRCVPMSTPKTDRRVAPSSIAIWRVLTHLHAESLNPRLHQRFSRLDPHLQSLASDALCHQFPMTIKSRWARARPPQQGVCGEVPKGRPQTPERLGLISRVGVTGT